MEHENMNFSQNEMVKLLAFVSGVVLLRKHKPVITIGLSSSCNKQELLKSNVSCQGISVVILTA